MGWSDTWSNNSGHVFSIEVRDLLLMSIVRVNRPFQGGASFVDPFCYLCFMLVIVMPSCLFLAALWSPAGLASWLSCAWCFLFLSLFHMLPRVVVVVSIPDLCLLIYFE